MKSDIVSFNVAKLVKKVGFNLFVEHFYADGYDSPQKLYPIRMYEHLANYGEEIVTYFDGFYDWNSLEEDNKMSMQTAFSESNEENYNVICSAPTQSSLQKWLRKKHNIIVNIQGFYDDNYDFPIFEYTIDMPQYSSMKEEYYIYELRLPIEKKVNNKLKYYGTNYKDLLDKALEDALNFLIKNRI